MVLSRTPWIEGGVLRNLSYDEAYARKMGTRSQVQPFITTLEFKGPTQTLDEMIASTRRGLWVHRLAGSAPAVVNYRTLLQTGTTRDGTFLIENGKITKAVKNLRWLESPFFTLNKVEAFGPAVRAEENYVAPRLKVRDYAFTSLSDAV